MSHVRLTIVALSLILPTAASAADGGIYLYLQPMPSEAARLVFAVGSVTAVTASGGEYPLTLHLRTVDAAAAERQRLLASGRLPAGTYAGFVFTVKRAALKAERGEVALTVPDAPVRSDAGFVVATGQSPVLWLELAYERAVSSEFGFSPAFSFRVPPRPIADHVGFASNSGSATITVFDKSLMQAIAVVDTCGGPSGMALDQRRRRLYVACSKDDELQAIDVATAEILERVRLSPGDRPRELALTPDGLTLLAVSTGSDSVSFFDTASLTRQERVNVGSGPGSILVDPTGRRAFVFNTLSGSLSVIEIASRSLVATVSVDAAPLRGQFNRRGDRLYVIHDRSPFMTVVDPRQLTIVTRARLRVGVGAIAVDPVRDLVCIGGPHDTSIEFYDPHALMPLYSMRSPAGVSYLAVDAEANLLYMVSPETKSVVVGRLADRKVVSEIDIGERPYWVSIMGER